MRNLRFHSPLLFSVVLGLVLHAPHSRAEEPPAAGSAMNLEACVREALLSNPTAQEVLAAASAAEEAAAAAGAAFLPEASLSLTSRRFESRAFLPSTLSALAGPDASFSPVIGPVNQHAYALRASYTLFDGGRRRARKNQAKAGAEEIRAGAARTRVDLVYEVHRAYFGLLLAKESLQVAESGLARCREHLRLAEERHREGAVPLLDVLRAQAIAADAEVAKVHAASEVEVARGTLNALLGRSPESPLEITALPEEPGEGPRPSLEELLASAPARRPEVTAAAEHRQTALYRLAEARSAYLPTIRVEASIGRLDDRFFPSDPDRSVGLVFSLPLFTGFARGHETRRARFDLLRAGEEARAVDLAVRREVFEAFQRLKEAEAAREAVKDFVRKAEESLRMARERYTEGAGTGADLLDAEASLREAQQAEAEARFGLRLAWSSLLRTSGRLDAGSSP